MTAPAPERVNVKAILADPAQRAELLAGAARFLCQLEHTHPPPERMKEWRMREEITRLRAALAAKDAEIAALKGDRDDLLKDWSVLAQRNADLLARAEKAEAEVERLKQRISEGIVSLCICENAASPRPDCPCVTCTVKRAEADNARLRAALEEIDNYAYLDPVIVRIVREALEEK